MAPGFEASLLTEDGFLGGRLQMLQPKAGYRAAMDSVLLAAAVPARPGETVLELGCGAGVAALCLAARVAGLSLTGLELQENYADLARRNAEANGIAFEVICGDLAALPVGLRALNFDHIIANPPYYDADAGTPAQDGGRETALREATPLALWVKVGLQRLKPGGWITMIQASDRLPDIIAALGTGAGNVTVLPIQPRIGRSARRVIVQARKGARGPFRLLAPLVLHEGAAHLADGDDYSAEARAILREGRGLQL